MATEQTREALSQRPDDALGAHHDGGEIQLGTGDPNPIRAGPLDIAPPMGNRDERFRRNAADIQTDPADRSPFNQGDTQAAPAGRHRSRVPTRTASKDGQITRTAHAVDALSIPRMHVQRLDGDRWQAQETTESEGRILAHYLTGSDSGGT